MRAIKSLCNCVVFAHKTRGRDGAMRTAYLYRQPDAKMRSPHQAVQHIANNIQLLIAILCFVLETYDVISIMKLNVVIAGGLLGSFFLPVLKTSFAFSPSHRTHELANRSQTHRVATELKLFGNRTPKKTRNDKETPEEEFESLLQVAMLLEQEKDLKLYDKLYHRKPDYWFDAEKGIITFKDKETKAELAHSKVQMIGTFGKESQTLMWAWHEHHAQAIPPEQLETVSNMRKVGEDLHFDNLTIPVVQCDEEYAGKLASFASNLVSNSDGVFRLDFGPCWWYMNLEKVIFAEDGEDDDTESEDDTEAEDDMEAFEDDTETEDDTVSTS